MSDDGSSRSGAAAQAVGEAVVKPVQEQLGKGIEDITQSVFGSSPKKPQTQADVIKLQQKQANDQKKVSNILQFFRTLRNQEEASKQRKMMEEQQKKVDEDQEKQEKMKINQYKAVQRKQQMSMAQQQAKTAKERKLGVGG